MRSHFRRAFALLLPAALAAVAITCTGDNASPDRQTGPDVPLLAGAPSTLKITVQPPAGALDSEVWIPSRQPTVVVKDANGVVVPGVTVTASIASGTLQGKAAITTNGSGVAKFVDLGIAGTGPHTVSFSTGGPSVTSATVTVSALPAEATTGAWDVPVDWDIVPLHMSLLPTGKVLAWGKYENGTTSASQPRLWNPASGPPKLTAVAISEPDMLFCSGHALMADGKLMVSGGHYGDDRGLRVTNIFDPVSETWASGLPKMALGRWYPTVTMLPDGKMVTVAGRDSASRVVTVPEIWEGGRWVRLPGASFTFPYYPRDFVDPKTGRLFYAGERIQARWLDVDAVTANGRGKWTSSTGLKHQWPFNRDYGSAVMYATGKILVVGGGGYTGWSTPDPRSATPTATAETIDLNRAGPSWKTIEPMHHPRRHLNATVLPNGQVLVTGGTSGGGFNDLASAVHAAEVWDPGTGHWTELAANSVDRVYHSVSLLLPDGTVLHGASGDANDPSKQAYPARRSHEIFRPPYLFKGARPVITSLAQTTVGYSQVLTVNTSYAQQITRVRWIRLGSVTHAFDTGQRADSLGFSKTASAVKVTTPSVPRKAPPGYYMLFILNRNGVPSVGQIVRLQ
jgi:galactose oxidase